jgi:hypothetical protein
MDMESIAENRINFCSMYEYLDLMVVVNVGR